MTSSFNERQALLKEHFGIALARDQYAVALAGNPNVGKSTIFNALTGLHQHTGNWPGKTVDNAQGTFSHQEQNFLLVDLPGTYSILAHSAEEEVARAFLCFGEPDAVLVVLDASCLERNLNLALQILEITPHVIVCVNLLDEAARRGIAVDLKQLRRQLGVPVIGATARTGAGIDKIKAALCELTGGTAALRPRPMRYAPEIEAAVEKILPLLTPLALPPQKKRWIALRLLEGEPGIIASIQQEAMKWINK